MSDAQFQAEWLALREPVDHRSRAFGLLEPLVSAWEAAAWSEVVDLGSGTGSNLRYLCSRLPGPQRWTLIDHDAALLSEARPCGEARTVSTVHGDLTDVGLAAVTGAHLVTASALLDLVSDAWLSSLVEACVRRRCGVLLALSYDGQVSWEGESHADDRRVLDAVNAHQIRDKGLGAALGPEAGPRAEALFGQAGYRTWLEPSPWRLGPPDRGLARALVDGWEGAAAEGWPDGAGRIRSWAAERREGLSGDSWGLTVGHMDVLALPPQES